MNITEFKRIVTAFADTPESVILDRERLVFALREELIEVTLAIRGGELWVDEGGNHNSGRDWIVNRLARLPLLADRILSQLPEEKHFIAPKAEVLEGFEVSPEDSAVQSEDAVSALRTLIAKRPAGVTSIAYLTSDAGEGKTTVIQQLARSQAGAYRTRQSDWLLLPIPLGGKPFLRFDEVMIATLVNRFRFQLWYYDALLELVKLGMVIPALDGFEEMFVESSTGDAMGGLCNLVESLDSQGSILISARKAYFEFKSLETQSRLMDSIRDSNVSFSKVALERWDRGQFIAYCEMRGVGKGESVWDVMSDRLKPNHPLLTRPVLVKALVGMLASANDAGLLAKQLSGGGPDFFEKFVAALLRREAEEKWLDNGGEARALLTRAEHEELLSDVALEMWSSRGEQLRDDVLRLVATMFVEKRRFPHSVSRQVVERISTHALLVQVGGTKGIAAFDHPEFYHFFLGLALAHAIRDKDIPSLRDILRRAVLPRFSIETAARRLREWSSAKAEVIELVGVAVRDEGVASSAAENAGSVFIDLLDGWSAGGIQISRVVFPPESLNSRTLQSVRFDSCRFQPVSLEKVVIRDTAFVNCQFERIDIPEKLCVEGVRWEGSTCSAIHLIEKDVTLYDPNAISGALHRSGFQFPAELQRQLPLDNALEPSEELKMVERGLRVFFKSSEVNVSVFKAKLGKNSNAFLDEILPALEKAGVLVEVKYEGGGRQKRYKLGVRLQTVQRCLASSGGSMQGFLQRIRESA